MRIPFTRFFGPSTTLIALLVGGWYLLTHAPPPVDLATHETSSTTMGSIGDNRPLPNTSSSTMPGTSLGSRIATPPVMAPRIKPNDRIIVGTYNIQDFGASKSSKREVMAIIADIVRRFDVLAIQELSSVDQTVLPKLMAIINASGARYESIASERLGTSSQKEQYVFLWDSTRVRLAPNSNYEVQDSGNYMEREPFVASFIVNVQPYQGIQPFRFTMINVHTKPDTVVRELNALDDVYRSVRSYEAPEEDVLLVGDLNAAVDQLQELGHLPGIVSAAGVVPTNTAGDKQYDYILFDRTTTTEFIPGRAGVINYQRDYGLSLENAKIVSDHCPVWAEFTLYERPAGTVAALPR